MGRQNKTGLDYFPVNIDMDEEDERIYMLEANFEGERAFGVLIKLLMCIYRHGYYYPWTEREQVFFSRKKNVDLDYCRRIVDFLIQKGFFCKRLFDTYGILTSRGIQKRYFEAVSRRQKIVFIQDFLLLDPVEINVNINISYVDFKKINAYKNGINVSRNGENVDIKGVSVGMMPTEIHKGEERRVKERKGEESKEKNIDGLKAVETSYFQLFEQEFGNKPDYKYPRDRKILKDYLKKYPVEQIVELLQIWFYCRIGDWNGYAVTGLIKDFNKLLVTWQKLGMNCFTPEEYEVYAANVEKVNREHKKNIEVPPYEKWREENFRRRFEEVKVPP